MTDTTTTPTEAPERFIYAPEGMAWVEGHDHNPGHWADGEDYVDQPRVRYPEPSPDGEAFSPGVYVPADEPASKADLMALAATVAEMEERWQMLATRLTGVAAIIDMRNSPDG